MSMRIMCMFSFKRLQLFVLHHYYVSACRWGHEEPRWMNDGPPLPKNDIFGAAPIS